MDDPLYTLGAVNSLASLAGTGAKVSLSLLDKSSQTDLVDDELCELGINISLFCAVLKQLQKTLQDGKRSRASSTAVSIATQIVKRCRGIFDGIQETIVDLNVHKTGEAPADRKARTRWMLKRSKVRTHRATLDSCKVTLSLLTNILRYADLKASYRSYNGEGPGSELAEEEAVVRSLALAQIRAIERLMAVELEEEQDLKETADGADTKLSLTQREMFGAASARLSTDLFSASPDVTKTLSSNISFDLPFQSSPEKASSWLNRLLLDDTSGTPPAWATTYPSTDSVAKPPTINDLLSKWTVTTKQPAKTPNGPASSTSMFGRGISRPGAPTNLGKLPLNISLADAGVRQAFSLPISPVSRSELDSVNGATLIGGGVGGVGIGSGGGSGMVDDDPAWRFEKSDAASSSSGGMHL